jgi:hypothetical protein
VARLSDVYSGTFERDGGPCCLILGLGIKRAHRFCVSPSLSYGLTGAKPPPFRVKLVRLSDLVKESLRCSVIWTYCRNCSVLGRLDYNRQLRRLSAIHRRCVIVARALGVHHYTVSLKPSRWTSHSNPRGAREVFRCNLGYGNRNDAAI